MRNGRRCLLGRSYNIRGAFPKREEEELLLLPCCTVHKFTRSTGYTHVL